ncbi:ankyrin repeat and LEM domain-containing protein 1 isoform X2 [Pyxicephalus adspersus]|uniref:ankyrin repeat and LEM domain-containing protein 1 isoform X2 n=1 Tax=Pyxicephalus adspersus TaxID=30357 RepID=UPI003B5A3096
MAALAKKLCEAVENEDAKEVENLLKCGADPNLVLPEGIAAIHLASGKESESALRCLTMILQQGGDPNVRSIEELTPVHVAASWGCCKALMFLLRKGGDPNVQDQDGNSALDLALMEKNRRCVVAIQEYNERNEDICPDQIHGYYKNNSCEPDDIPEMSSITLLLESAYEASPCSSTKFSPFVSASKNGTTGKGANDAVLTSQIELPAFDFRSRSRSYEHKFAGLESCELQQNDKTTNNTSDLKLDDSETECSVLTLQNQHCKKDCLYSYSAKMAEGNKTHTSENINSSEGWNIRLEHSSKLTESQFILKEWEGLDVTSPDHVYTYSRSHNDNDMEKTLVLPKTNMFVDEVNQDVSSSSMYTSCFSDGFDTLMENSVTIAKEKLVSDKYCKSLLDSNRNKVCSENSGVVKTNLNVCSILHVEGSLVGAVDTVETTNAGQNMVSNSQENKPARTTHRLCNSQPLTLPEVDTNAYENHSQDLRTRLRNLMLSAKGCRSNLEQGNYSLPGCSEPRVESSCSSTVPITGEKSPPIGQNLKNISSTCLNTPSDTLIVDSGECEIKELDADLKKMMLATKVVHPVSSTLSEEKSPCFFTERTKSRLLTSKTRHGDSSLFDDSLEMPKRGMRLRSPDRCSDPTLSPVEVRKNFSCNGLLFEDEPTMQACVKQNTCLVQTPKNLTSNVSEPETTVSISNFLTDDLSSSETEVKSTPLLKKTSTDPYLESKISESVWLTEDGDTESSAEAVLDSNKLEKALPAALQSQSFFHSTINEETALNKAPRYSFSRLSCVPKADETGIKLTTLPDPVREEVNLSPGGRPVNVSNFEPVEYLYVDNEKGHALVEKHLPCIDQSSSNISDASEDTIVYDWKNYSTLKEKIKKDSPASTPSRVAVELYRLSNDEIARRLRGLGEDPGQVNSKTRKVCILLLDKRLKEQATSGPVGLSLEYSPELSLALRTYNIPDCNHDEELLSQEFDQPDKTKKWREGVLKSSFNYLLLDPRVTQNLPSRCHTLSFPQCLRTFVQAVFYVGKGKRARPYCHLYESLTHYKGSIKQVLKC